MKKLKVNTEGCIGCGACVALDPEHFDFNEEGLSTVINEDNIQVEKIKTIIESCPVNVISYEESEHDECPNHDCQNDKEHECGCQENEECNCQHDECRCQESENNTCQCNECDCQKENKKDAE